MLRSWSCFDWRNELNRKSDYTFIHCSNIIWLPVVYLFRVRTVSLLFDIWNLGIPNFNTDACALTVQAQSAEYMKRKAPSISENYNLHSEKPKLPGNMMFRLGIKTRNTQKLLCSRKRNLLSICNTYHRYMFHFISLIDWIFTEYLTRRSPASATWLPC
jgi:hypothetical protein